MLKQLSIEKRKMITGVEDTDLEICSKLGFQDLVTMSKVNKNFNEIIDDGFWKSKVDQDFDGVSEFKPPEEEHIHQYHYLTYYPYRRSNKNDPRWPPATVAFFFKRNRGRQEGIIWALIYFELDVLEFNKEFILKALKGEIKDDMINDDPAEGRCFLSSFNIDPKSFVWLTDSGFCPNNFQINHLLFFGDATSVVEWLVWAGVKPDERFLIPALKGRMYDWIEKQGFNPVDHDFIGAAMALTQMWEIPAAEAALAHYNL
jgi:hypothetical protein